MSTSIRIRIAATAIFGTMCGAAQADLITYDTWTSNDGDSGNYILTVDDNLAGLFNIVLTVDPWNAEALGLFVDFGDVDIGGPVGLSNEMPVGEVSLFATDTSSNNCGAGCNINGLSAPLAGPDDEWELVFRLGSQGFNSIQTFSWQINDQGLELSDWGLVGARAQQLCAPGNVLSDNDDSNCGGSDKSYGSPPPPMNVAEPGTLALFGIGLLALGFARRRDSVAA